MTLGLSPNAKASGTVVAQNKVVVPKDDEVHEESLLSRSDAEELLIASANRRKANSKWS